MADKRYYWFKMEQSFFEQKEIKYLRRLPGGDTYTIIYLKLILKSLENDGKIYYENIGDDSETASAERKRRQRERERELLQFKDVTDSQKNVTLSQVGHIESEIEIEKEIENEVEASTATSTKSN